MKFKLWAPTAEKVDLCLLGFYPQKLERKANGWHEIEAKVKPGDQYQFLIDGRIKVPDPGSNFQREDVNGPSEIIDHSYKWQHSNWPGRPWEEAVIYELHVGTFSPEGTYKGVEEKLDYLKDLGITAIELMPLADFAGCRGWGYDGVYPYAPDSVYGEPDDLKSLIDAAHGKGIMVFLDVVYNHFGPSGNYLHEYAAPFFTDKFKTPWGSAINFGERPVRDFFINNALYWLHEYRFDGLRFDAVHAIYDDSKKHFLYELSEKIRNEISSGRYVHLILENDKNESRYLEREKAAPKFLSAVE